MLTAYNGKQPGDPSKLVEVMVDIARKEGIVAGRNLPTVLPLGSDSYRIINEYCDRTKSTLEVWKDVILSTDFPQGA
ncbi:hypothetical protein FRC02_007895 [Tulasnella sp. 418]|nr:hypothetical protein FRC02_007895 [Tulasnella sp. 418]